MPTRKDSTAFGSTSEVGRRYGWHPSTVRRLIASGAIRASRANGHFRIPFAAVERFLVETSVVVRNTDREFVERLLEQESNRK